nr:hypothetical protein [Pedococcus sp. 5OH_020]
MRMSAGFVGQLRTLTMSSQQGPAAARIFCTFNHACRACVFKVSGMAPVGVNPGVPQAMTWTAWPDTGTST